MIFNNPININKITLSNDDYGGSSESIALYVKTGASIMQLSQRDAVSSAGDETNKAMMKFFIRRTPKTFALNNSEYQIVTLANNEVWNIENVDHFTLKHKKIIIIFAHRFEG